MERFKYIVQSLLLLMVCSSANAADLEREQRLKNQIIDYILDGDPVMLTADQHEFLSIYQPADDADSTFGMVLMHGRGFHPNWPEVIYPLRTRLPADGWHTLSIQMPVLDNQATFYDYLDIIPQAFPRIQAAIDYLVAQGVNRIVLLAHSCSVHMSVAWLAQRGDPHVIGFIGVGMGSTDKGQPLPEPLPLDKLNVPVLDVRGEHDYPAVHGRAPERWRYLQKAGQAGSRQLVVEDADHYFRDRGDVLLNVVEDWLRQFKP